MLKSIGVMALCIIGVAGMIIDMVAKFALFCIGLEYLGIIKRKGE